MSGLFSLKCVLLLLFVLARSCLFKAQTIDQIDLICKSVRDDCQACILAHPECSWCAAPLNSTICTQFRCRHFSKNEAFCSSGYVDNPQNLVTVSRDEPFSTVDLDNQADNVTIVQLRPQALTVKLRPGQSQKVTFTFRRVVDYPLDLYYVMDLSYSMRDDLETLQNLGSSLVEAIRNVSDNVRFGFGSFVDKVMMPFTGTQAQLLEDPCFSISDATCSPAFGFNHQLPITSNGEAFREAVRATNISGNLDSPEGGFDALLQIAVCQKDIRWRENSLKVILFTSDASPHIALDGQLATILDLNDMQCHLERGVNFFLPDAMVYAKSRIQDYPSIGQLKKVFEDNKIQTIFAVTKAVLPLYQEFPGLIPNTFVDTLAADSSNVIAVLSSSYEEIRRNLQMNVPSMPDNIDLQYRVKCPGASFLDNSLTCNNVSIGDEVVFELELRAKACPSNPSSSDVIQVTSTTVSDVARMMIEYVCDCDCASVSEPDSDQCSEEGSLQCGLCSCGDGLDGSKCQCSVPTTGPSLDAQCTRSEYVEGISLCSDHGCCECGECECDSGFFGDYCHCTSTGCPQDTGGICGGLEQGICENCDNNPICICNSRWSRDGLGVCSCNEYKFCRRDDNSLTCSDNGRCDCDRCTCDQDSNNNVIYDGQYCEECIHPQCSVSGTCFGEEIQECARCVYEEGRENNDVAAECATVCQDRELIYRRVESLPDCYACLGVSSDECSVCDAVSTDRSLHAPVTCSSSTSISNCIVTYLITWNTALRRYVIFVREYERVVDCPELDPLLIVLPVALGIVFFGLLALLLWKLFQRIRDEREWKRFEKERQMAKWAENENPIFASPKIRFENPGFVDNEPKLDITMQ